jgi:shikimate dehydrogenase
VLGQPISHSLSPLLHRTAYAELGLTDWSYDRFEVGRGELAGVVAGCDETWRGLSLTMPLKDEALALGRLTPTAELTRAANTLIFAESGIELHNTDVEGFWRPLVTHFGVSDPALVPIESAVILGGGATARSAFVALVTMGVRRITVSARTAAKVMAWGPMFEATGVTPEVVPYGALVESDLLISAVTAGAADELAESVADTQPIVFDALYDPWPTELARVAADRGRLVFSGLDMLAGQAVGQVALMTGRTVAADVLLSAGREALRQRGVL